MIYHVDETIDMHFKVDNDSLGGLATRKNFAIVTVEQVRVQPLVAIQSVCSQGITFQLTLSGHIKTAGQRTIIHQYGYWCTGR